MLLRVLLAAVVLTWCPSAVLADHHGEAKAAAEGHDAEDHHAGDHGHGDHAHDGAGAHGGEGHAAAGPDPLAFDPDLAIFTLIVFGLLAAILRFTAWGPIVEGLAAREANISGQIAEATAKHEEAKALLAKHEAKLASAADDVREMLEEARRDAEATKGQIVADAQAEAQAALDRGIRDVEQARDSAVKQLAEQSANLSIDLAAKVVKQEITPQRQGEIVGEALNRLASSSPSSN